MQRVLALGAHYDDIEVGVGGILHKHICKGDEVFMAITSSDEYRTGKIDLRYEEQLEALTILGVPTDNLLLFNEHDNISGVIGKLDLLKIDNVYTPFELDTHQAHKRCSYIGQSVGRKLPIQLGFYNSGSSYNFQPNAFSIIDFNFKYRLLNCFKSQIELNAINLSIIQKRESYWASMITNEDTYAEGIFIRKILYEV